MTGDQTVTYSARMDRVFKALADPTRRRLLDALFTQGGQSLAALCADHPELTRFAVMKHLRVLEEADLVITLKQGRTKLHYLNAVPIGQVADRWISKYSAHHTAALVGLARGLEESHLSHGAPR